ncbi:MAG: hypothetical protein JO108_22930 [Acidobacteriaceae bacterium]|nr:hypothetical protein [Acidobacteriaceae bacterium]
MKRIAAYFSAAFALAILFTVPAARADTTYNFQTLNNNTDPTFNQLLGVNNAGEIAGYYGSGATDHPNKGYTLAPPYGQGNYTNENFTNSVQTQVTGLNNNGTTVGFWADADGNNFGFYKQGSGSFVQVVNPNTGGGTVNQLLGVNDVNLAVGFYQDANGVPHGYTYSIPGSSFAPVGPNGATSSTATGINNNGLISGFFADANGNQHGFIDNAGNYMTFDDPNGTNTAFLGISNTQAVGTFVDPNGVTNGFVFNLLSQTFQTVNDPNASPNPAFDVTGTTINGINDKGQLVGFFSDGTNVNGFLASPVPEPTTLAMGSLGALLALVGLKNRKKK